MSFPLFTRDYHVGFRLHRDAAGVAELHGFACRIVNIRRMWWLPRLQPLASAHRSITVRLPALPAATPFAECVAAAADALGDTSDLAAGRQPPTLFEVLVQHEQQIGHTRYGFHCDVFQRGFDRDIAAAFDRALEAQFDRDMDALVAAASPEERKEASRDVRIEMRGDGAYAWEAVWVRDRLSRFARP